MAQAKLFETLRQIERRATGADKETKGLQAESRRIDFVIESANDAALSHLRYAVLHGRYRSAQIPGHCAQRFELPMSQIGKELMVEIIRHPGVIPGFEKE